MPHSNLHKKKLKKNLMIGGMVLLWVALIWIVTMIRIANAESLPPLPSAYTGHKTKLQSHYSGQNPLPNPYGNQNPLPSHYSNQNPLPSVYSGQKTPLPNIWRGKSYNGVGMEHSPVDMVKPFSSQRHDRLENVEDQHEFWNNEYQRQSGNRQRLKEANDIMRLQELDKITNRKDEWDKAWYDTKDKQMQQEQADEMRRAAWREEVEAKPQKWWDDWTAHQKTKD